MLLIAAIFLGFFSSFTLNEIPMAVEEPIVWQCEASGDWRSYQVNDLDMLAPIFDIQIYRGADYGVLLESASVSQALVEAPGHQWLGQTGEGHELKVTALANNLVFEVKDSQYGKAVGRCIRHTTIN